MSYEKSEPEKVSLNYVHNCDDHEKAPLKNNNINMIQITINIFLLNNLGQLTRQQYFKGSDTS